MTNTFQVAARLRGMDDDELVRLLDARRFGSGAPSAPLGSIRDFFDLADALLAPDTVQLALERLDRVALAALAALGAESRETTGRRAVPLERVTARLAAWAPDSAPDTTAVEGRLQAAAELFLLERHPDGFVAYTSVRAQLEAWPQLGLPGGPQLASDGPPAALAVVPGTESRFTDRLASEHAFTAVNQVATLLEVLGREPARELQKGGLGLPDTKRVAAALAEPLSLVPTVLSLADRAGLVALESGVWMPTRDGERWQSEPTTERWSRLTGAWHAALPPDIRVLLSDRAHAAWGDSLREYVAWAYPAGGEDVQERVSEFVRDAERLGITANDAPSRAGALLLETTDPEPAPVPPVVIDAIAEHFPAEVRQVYLQNDLTVVSPGPLEPAIDARLRRMAEQESRGLAATYRISAESLNRAIAEGETGESIRSFLLSVSATGIPQPLDYLINDAAERYGRVRVAPAGTREEDRSDRPGCVVRSSDPELLTTIEVDTSLAALALERRDPVTLTSRRSRDEVFWALNEARYPVAAEDSAGDPVSLHRDAVASTAGEAASARTAPNGLRSPGPRRAAPAGQTPARALVERLRETSPDTRDARAAWLARQLDVAIRGHIPLTVSVRMPDGGLVDYLLEPTGSAGGRLRGRDRAADLERTLPLSRIEAVETADADE